MRVIAGGRGGSRKRGGGGGGDDGSRDGSSDWKTRLSFNRDGNVIAGFHNLLLILEHDRVVGDALALNTFANRVIYRRGMPWGRLAGDEFVEEDFGEIAGWLGDPATYEVNVRAALVADCVATSAARRKFHPVREYLESLRWDGQKRVCALFPSIFGAAADAYTARVATIFLVSAVARVMQPGCKVDTMLVLEGPQGAGKTRATRELFGADWYAEAMESPATKDFDQALRGRWVVEIGEMESFSKAEVGKIKQALSTQTDHYRPSYQRLTQAFPRQCVFVGTTNENNYLRDPTGARRFLPVRVSVVAIERLREQRDQLWAEAVELYRAGTDWWTLPEGAEVQQEARYMADAWEDSIARWLTGTLGEKHYPSDLDTRPVEEGGGIRSVSISEVMSYALQMDIGKHGKTEQMRVAAVMQRLRWHKVHARYNGRVVNRWYWPGHQGGPDVPF